MVDYIERIKKKKLKKTELPPAGSKKREGEGEGKEEGEGRRSGFLKQAHTGP